MQDKDFRWLSSEEQEQFRQWARENWKPNTEPDPLWHPVVRDEWAKLDAKAPLPDWAHDNGDGTVSGDF